MFKAHRRGTGREKKSTAVAANRECKFGVKDNSLASLRIRLSDTRTPYRTGCGSARVITCDYPGATAPGSEYRQMRKSQWSRRFQASLARCSERPHTGALLECGDKFLAFRR